MRCPLCDYESSSLNSDDADTEIERHKALEHPVSSIWLPHLKDLLELHLKYGVGIDDLITKMKEIRDRMAEENRRDYRELR